MRFIFHNKILFVFISIAVIYLYAFKTYRWYGKTNEEWKHILWSDARGYYYYLPSIFIYNDLDKQPFDPLYTVVNNEGKLVNRYYVGTSVLEAPFFFIACAHAKLVGEKIDGKSKPFAFWVGIAPIVYVLLGLYFLFRLLFAMHVSQNYTLFLITVAAFGTNLFYYTVYKGNFSHAFSFFSITGFLFFLQKFASGKVNFKVIFSIGFFATCVVFVRPINMLVFLFVPFFFENFKNFIDGCKVIIVKFKYILSISICFFIIALFQIYVWHKQSGHFIQWSYNQEGFYFTNPKILAQLFSFDQGLFIYNPVLIFGFIAALFLFYKQKYRFYCAIVFLGAFVYITASWWSHTYGNSFSIRPYTDITAVFILFIGLLIIQLRKRYIVIGLLIICSMMNLLYSYQFYAEILPGTGMNAQKYFTIFGKTSKKYRNCFGGMYDLPPYAPNGMERIFTYYNKSIEQKPIDCSDIEFPIGTKMVYPNKKKNVRHVWYVVELDYLIPKKTNMNEALLVFDIQDTVKNKLVYYAAFPIKNYVFEENGCIRKNKFTIWFPNLIHGGNRVGIYIWNKEKEPVYLSKYKVNGYVPLW